MTISSQTRTAGPFTGNGVTTTFPFTFKVFAASDLYVVRTDATTGIDTVLVLGTDYTVTLNTNQNSSPGGSITLPTALASGFKLTATSALQYLQPTDLTNQGGFYPKVINNALDYLTVLVQQLLTKVGNSLQLPISVTGVSTTLPSPVGTQVIGWNSAGTALQNYSSNSFASAVSYGQTQALVTNGTGSKTAFTITTSGVTVNNIKAFIGGSAQRPGIDYTLSTDGLVVTFTTAPPAGTNNVFITWQQGLPMGTVPDGAVTTTTVLDGAITAAKLASGAAASNVGAGGVSAAMLATSAVTTAKLADGAVTTVKMADGSVTAPKLGTTGSASSATFLRGDMQWTDPTVATDVQTFNSTGTWTKPTGGQKMARIQVWGGGGGGSRQTANNAAAGGGGGYNELTVPLTYLAASLTATVGSGGAGATTAATSGGNGGSSAVPLASAWQGLSQVFAGGGAGGTTVPGCGGGPTGSATAGTGLPGTPLLVTGLYWDGTTNNLMYAGIGAGSAIANIGSSQAVSGAFHGGGGSKYITSAVGLNVGGSSLYGGGGGSFGQSVSAVLEPGGQSVYGGTGGSASNAVANAGVQPGGGGGASGTATVNGGNGAAGRVVITCW